MTLRHRIAAVRQAILANRQSRTGNDHCCHWWVIFVSFDEKSQEVEDGFCLLCGRMPVHEIQADFSSQTPQSVETALSSQTILGKPNVIRPSTIPQIRH